MNTLKALYKQNQKKILHLSVSLAFILLTRKFFFFLKTQYYHSLYSPFKFQPVRILKFLEGEGTLVLRKRRTLKEFLLRKAFHDEFRATLLASIYVCPSRLRQGKFEIASAEDMQILLYFHSSLGQLRCLNSELVNKAWAQLKDTPIDPEQDELLYDTYSFMFERERHCKKYEKGIWGKYKSSYFEKKYGFGGIGSYFAEKKDKLLWFMNRTK